MFVSLNWIKQYVDLPVDLKAEDLAERLTVAVVEVEGVSYQAKDYEKMAVAEVLDIVKHEQADKLQVLKVDAGPNGKLQVVCGAGNVYKGMKGVLALPGAMVKWHGQGELMALEQTKIRGVESFGMLCASEEIGLTGEFNNDGVIELPANLKNGIAISKALGLNDVIIEIDNKSLTNRPDLWGHYGIAREISALYGLKLKQIPLAEFKAGKAIDLKVKVEEPELCPRYQALAMSGIKIAPSPFWLKNLLKSAGLRPVNNIVDITNYVMLELGQPLHAFDRRNVKNDGIVVKRADSKEFFSTLDGVKRQLDNSMLLISDSEKTLAVAGVMGGENSQIVEDTSEIIIESANFEPTSVRKTSVKLGLRTDASSRFEKSLDPTLTELAIKRVISLIKEIIPEASASSPIVDANNFETRDLVIELGLDFLAKRLGKEIPKKEIIRILESLFFKVKDSGEVLKVAVPSFRATKDISLPEDLVEEVARIYGYDNIEPALPLADMNPAASASPAFYFLAKIKNFLAYGLGATEIYNNSLVSAAQIDLASGQKEKHLELANYLNPDQQYLRSSLLEGLLKNLEDNIRFSKSLNLFEAGRVFSSGKGDFAFDNSNKEFLCNQPLMLAGLLYGAQDPFLKVKGMVEQLLDHVDVAFNWNAKAKSPQPFLNPEAYLEITVGGEIAGWIGLDSPATQTKLNLRQSIALWQLEPDVLLKYSAERIKYLPSPKYPGMTYDFSVIVPEKSAWADIRGEVLNASPLIIRAELFDTYRISSLGADKKSLSFHVNLQDENKTLTSEEGDRAKEKISSALVKKFKAEIR